MKTKSASFVALLVFCLAGALALSIEAVRSPSSPQLWRGFYTVLVADGQSVAAIQKRLEAAGLSAVTSENTYVSFTDFAADSRELVARLPDRLELIDPRYDTYMKELPAYFHQGRWNIVYVRTDQSLPIAYLRISRALRGLQWRVADFNGRGILLCLLLWALVTSFAALRTRRSSVATWTLLAGSLAWLSAPLGGSYVATLAAALVYLGWSTIVELGHPLLRYYLDYGLFEGVRLRPAAAVAVAALFAASVLGGVDSSIFGVVLPAFGAMVCVAGALVAWEHLRKAVRQHRLFYPLRITDAPKSLSYLVPRLLETMWVAAVLLLSPGILYASWGVGVEIPVPVVYSGLAHNSWKVLRGLWEHGDDPGLPDLADYVAHRAYQAGLAYGRAYSFPAPNEGIFESRYSREGDRIVSRLSRVKVYSEEWFRQILSHPQGIVGMLDQQPGTVLPTTKLLYNYGYPVRFVPVFWLVTIVLLLPALYVRRGIGFDTVGRAAGTVTLTAVWERPRRLSLPKKPSRNRREMVVAVEHRDLVSESDR